MWCDEVAGAQGAFAAKWRAHRQSWSTPTVRCSRQSAHADQLPPIRRCKRLVRPPGAQGGVAMGVASSAVARHIGPIGCRRWGWDTAEVVNAPCNAPSGILPKLGRVQDINLRFIQRACPANWPSPEDVSARSPSSVHNGAPIRSGTASPGAGTAEKNYSSLAADSSGQRALSIEIRAQRHYVSGHLGRGVRRAWTKLQQICPSGNGA